MSALRVEPGARGISYSLPGKEGMSDGLRVRRAPLSPASTGLFLSQHRGVPFSEAMPESAGLCCVPQTVPLAHPGTQSSLWCGMTLQMVGGSVVGLATHRVLGRRAHSEHPDPEGSGGV